MFLHGNCCVRAFCEIERLVSFTVAKQPFGSPILELKGNGCLYDTVCQNGMGPAQPNGALTIFQFLQLGGTKIHFF